MFRRNVVQQMHDSLLRQAQRAGVDLNGLTIDNFNTYLDDAFGDGGYIRCECFGDLATPYALQYGPIESDKFMEAQWKCIEEAIVLIRRTLDDGRHNDRP